MDRAYRNKRGYNVAVREMGQAPHFLLQVQLPVYGWQDCGGSHFYSTPTQAQAELDRRAARYGWTPIMEEGEDNDERSVD